MANVGEDRYLYIAEWDPRFTERQIVFVRRITLLPGVNKEDFEKHMIETTIPAVEGVTTRTGGVVRHTLLERQSGRKPVIDEVLNLHLGSFDAGTSSDFFNVVAAKSL